MKQAQRLAAIHDPSGHTFNVGAVITQDDGTVVSVEAVRRRQERQAAKQVLKNLDDVTSYSQAEAIDRKLKADLADPQSRESGVPKPLSNTQAKRLAADQSRPPPPKPVIPDEFSLPQGEENWLELWDASDEQIERRVMREKKRKAEERKALRHKQQMFKTERRAARDEKRRVYRDLKQTWKSIRGMLSAGE